MTNYKIHKVIEKAISQAESAECFSYKQEIQKLAQNFSDDQQKEIKILIDILSYYMNLEHPKQPFEPNLSDLTNEEIEVLINLYPYFNDCELKARIADVIWTRCKKYKYGLEAIDWYLSSAVKLEDWDSWTIFYDRVKRALQLALLLGKKNDKLEKVNKLIKDTIIRIDGRDPLYLTGRLLELILDQNNVEVEDYIPILDSKIEKYHEEKEFRLCSYYMDLKATCFQKMKLMDRYKETIINIAKSYENEAGYLDIEGNDNNARIIHLLENAIKTYRRLPNMQNKIDDLIKKLDKYQKQLSENLKEFSHEIEISNVVEKIRKTFHGKDKRACIAKLAFYPPITSKKELEDRVNEQYKHSPLSFLVNTDLIDNDGRRIIRMPDLHAKHEKEGMEAMEAYTLKEAASNHSIISGIIINHALKIIKEEHEYKKQDFQFLVEKNLFIPRGREEFFLQGIYEGFKGNFMIAIHLLIPQIENGFRRFAEMCGDTISTIENDGKEQVKSLNNIFELPNFVESYDEDLLFNLRSLFTEKYGSNIRNRLAHGLLTSEEASSSIAQYVWWISLRLCCMYSINLEEYISENNN